MKGCLREACGLRRVTLESQNKKRHNIMKKSENKQAKTREQFGPESWKRCQEFTTTKKVNLTGIKYREYKCKYTKDDDK